MSVLVKIKGFILPFIPANSGMRKAIVDSLNAVDADLDEGGYEPSSLAEEAVEALDTAYINEEKEALKNERLDEVERELSLTNEADNILTDNEDSNRAEILNEVTARHHYVDDLRSSDDEDEE